MMLLNYEICRVDDEEAAAPTKPFRFCVRRPGVPTLHLAADTESAVARWLEVLNHAAEESQMADAWLEQTRRNLGLPPNQIQKPDCFGYLVKLGTQWKSWSKRYCVLKDACLYFFQDANSKSAFGKSNFLIALTQPFLLSKTFQYNSHTQSDFRRLKNDYYVIPVYVL